MPNCHWSTHTPRRSSAQATTKKLGSWCRHKSASTRFPAQPTYSIRQHTSAYAGIRRHTSAYVSRRQHMPADVSIRVRRFRLVAESVHLPIHSEGGRERGRGDGGRAGGWVGGWGAGGAPEPAAPTPIYLSSYYYEGRRVPIYVSSYMCLHTDHECIRT